MYRQSVIGFAVALLAVPTTLHRPAPKKTVAVLYFDNYTGKADYDALGKGMASMMISDLSVVPEIQLVERDRMQDVMKEMDVQHTRYFDSTTAVKAGRMLGSQYIVVGSFAAVQPKMKIDTRVVSVETGAIVKTAQVTGDEDKFFDLQQRLAKDLVDGLGVALSPEEQAALSERQRQNRVEAVKSLLAFSLALNKYDRGDFGGAAESMLPALRMAPDAGFMKAAYDEMKRRAAASAADKAKDKIKAGLGGLLHRP